MSEYNNIPKIRFKGFTDVWEQRKLDDLGIATGGTSIETEFSSNGKYKVISIGSYSENSTYNDQGIRAIHSDKTKIRVLNKEDLTMILNDKTASGRIIGRVLYIEKSGEYVYNQRTERIEINRNLYNPRFIYHLLNAPEMRNKIIKQSQGNTQIFVNWNGIKNTEYLIPDLSEQSYLEKIFNNIDNLITLHQRKCDKLINIKKSMLEKMFPKNSSNIPEIRFKGFTDVWEQRKLEKICDIFDGTHQTPNYKTSGIPFLSVENIKTLTSEKYISYEDFKNNFKVFPEKNDILMTRIGDIGTTNIIKENGLKAYYVSLALLKCKGIDNLYLNYAIKSDFVQNGLKSRSLLTAIPMKINKDQIGKVEIRYPSEFKEQQNIGVIFENIDNLITLHQRKVEKLNNIKKSMLEKMFV